MVKFTSNKHPKLEVRGKGWHFFYHRGRTESRTLSFFKSQQPAPTPCGIKFLNNFTILEFQSKITIERMDFTQFGKQIMNLHTKIEEYMKFQFNTN